MEPSFETSTSGSWTVISVNGELDLSTSEALKSALDDGFGDTTPQIAVDLTDVTFMDSSSLGVLIAYMKRARERGGDVRLVGIQGSPAKVIALTGLDAAFQIDGSLGDLPD